jgi:hypothetical protein
MDWRDRIKVHPAVDAFPMLGDDALRALAAFSATKGPHG